VFRGDVVDQRACLVIEDAEGTPHAYTFTLFPRRDLPWLLTLRPVEKPGVEYEVLQTKAGPWRCQCWSWRTCRRVPPDCKHTRACVALVEWLRALRAGLPVGDNCEGR
jgi:hypothetical protein